MSLFRRYLKIPLVWKVVTGLVLGVVLGLTLGENAEVLAPIGQVFLRLLIMLALPVVFVMLIQGIMSVDPKAVGRMGAKILTYYFVTGLVAVALGLGLGLLFNPGKSLSGQTAEAPTAPGDTDWVKFLIDIFPENLFSGVVGTSPVTIVIVACLIAMPLSVLRYSKNASVRRGVQAIEDVTVALGEAISMLIRAVLQFAPIGLAALIARGIGTSGGGNVLGELGMLLLTVIIGCLLMLTVYAILMRAWGMKPLQYFRVTKEPTLMGFTTRSSSASLPVVIRSAEVGGASRSVAGFALPLGVQLNSDGSALTLGIYAVFAANFGGIDLAFGDLVVIAIIASLAAIGSGTVPGGQLVAMSVVFAQAGLPLAALGLIAAIDQPLGMMLTAVNVNGDLAGTFIVAKSEDQLDPRSPLVGGSGIPLKEITTVVDDADYEDA
jgi:Na+/H+-dicarboxylate symporter